MLDWVFQRDVSKGSWNQCLTRITDWVFDRMLDKIFDRHAGWSDSVLLGEWVGEWRASCWIKYLTGILAGVVDRDAG